MFVISGICCKVAENCTLVSYYAANSGNFLPVFQDNLSVPSSVFKNPQDNALDPNMGFLLDSWTLRMGLIGFPNMSVRITTTLHKNPEEHSSLHSLCCWWLSFHKHSISMYQTVFLKLPVLRSHIIHSGRSSHVADSMALIVHETFSRHLSFDAGIPYTMLMNDFHSYVVRVV